MYVGAAKMTPASRMPRRLPSVMSTISPSAKITRSSWSAGTNEEIAATPAALDTATVST